MGLSTGSDGPTLSGLSPWDAAQSGASRMGPMNSNTRAGACGIQRSRAFTEQGVAALQRIGFDSLRSQIAILNAARKSNGAASLSINGTQSGQGCAPSGRGMAQGGAAPRGCVSVCHLAGVGDRN